MNRASWKGRHLVVGSGRDGRALSTHSGSAGACGWRWEVGLNEGREGEDLPSAVSDFPDKPLPWLGALAGLQ